MGGQFGRHSLLNGLHLGVGLGSAQHTEAELDTFEQLTRVVECQHGVFERGLVVIVDDGVDFGIVYRHCLRQCGLEMLGLDAVKGRNAEAIVPLRK